MSKWFKTTNNNLKNTNFEILGKALGDMNLRLVKNTEIENSYGKSAVDYSLQEINTGNDLSLGFKKEFLSNGLDFELQLVGDFFLTGLNSKTFLDNLSQNYSKYNVLNAVEQAGYYVDENGVTTNSEGEIEIEAYQYA